MLTLEGIHDTIISTFNSTQGATMHMPEELRDFHDRFKKAKIESINLGGCLIFCLLVWRYLKAHNMETESFQLWQLDNGFSPDHAEANMQWAETNGKEGDTLSLWHFCCEYKGHKFDGDEIPCPQEITEALTGLNLAGQKPLIEEFCLSAINRDQWNFIFSRQNEIPKLQNAFPEVDLSDIEYDLSLKTTAKVVFG